MKQLRLCIALLLIALSLASCGQHMEDTDKIQTGGVWENLSLDFSEPNESTYRTLLEDYFDIVLEGDYRYSYEKTGDRSARVGYTFYHRGARTNLGFSATVEDGSIVSITVKKWNIIHKLLQDTSPSPVVTAEIVDKMKQAVDEEIKKRNPAYEITECDGSEVYYDADTDRYDYRMSIYYSDPKDITHGGLTYGFYVTYDLQTGKITLDEYK